MTYNNYRLRYKHTLIALTPCLLLLQIFKGARIITFAQPPTLKPEFRMNIKSLALSNMNFAPPSTFLLLIPPRTHTCQNHYMDRRIFGNMTLAVLVSVLT